MAAEATAEVGTASGARSAEARVAAALAVRERGHPRRNDQIGSDQGVGKLNSKLLDASLAPKDTSPTLSSRSLFVSLNSKLSCVTGIV